MPSLPQECRPSGDSERATKWQRVLPACLAGFHMHHSVLCDVLPQPPLPSVLIPSKSSPPSLSTWTSWMDDLDKSAPPLAADHTTRVQTLDTPLNRFNIFQCYHARNIPSHDPNAQIDLTMLSNLVHIHQSPYHQSSALTFDPYPNESTFLLGEWYWNQGTQKSQKSFKNLIDIVENPNFSIVDVQSTNWTQVNTELSLNDWDKSEWIHKDAGWQRSSVMIQVPFYHNASQPGVRDFTVNNFYH